MSGNTLKDGIPCDHPGCASHITHPCEGCGRINMWTLPPDVAPDTPEKLLVMRVAESKIGRDLSVRSLNEMITAFRAQTATLRKAYTKPPMSDACEYVSLAYDEAGAVFERALYDLEMAERFSKEDG